MSNIRTIEKQQVTSHAMAVDSGHGEHDLVVLEVFNNEKGTFAISCKITTKHLNQHDPDMNAPVFSDLQKLLQDAVESVFAKKTAWDEGQAEREYSGGGKVALFTPEVIREMVVTGKKKRTKKVDPDNGEGDPEPDPDGLQDL